MYGANLSPFFPMVSLMNDRAHLLQTQLHAQSSLAVSRSGRAKSPSGHHRTDYQHHHDQPCSHHGLGDGNPAQVEHGLNPNIHNPTSPRCHQVL